MSNSLILNDGFGIKLFNLISIKKQVIYMVNNIADAIEDYILQQLAAKEDGQVELKRTELASKISCAPSQISYVLSTRFTHEKGFVVESRRGLGGYIRITIIESIELKDDYIYKEMISKIEDGTKFEYVKSMIDYLLLHKMVTKREAELCAQFIYSLYNARAIGIQERTKLIRSVFITLSKMAELANK